MWNNGQDWYRRFETLHVTNPLNHRGFIQLRNWQAEKSVRLSSGWGMQAAFMKKNGLLFWKLARKARPNRGPNINRNARGFMTGAWQSWSKRQHTAASRQKLCNRLGRLQTVRGNIVLFFNKLQRLKNSSTPCFSGGIKVRPPVSWCFEHQAQNEKNPLKTLLNIHFFFF